MIEDELRDTFTRAEAMVSDASRLVPGIDRAVERRRARRRTVSTVAAACAALLAIALPTVGRGLLAGPSSQTPADQGLAESTAPIGALNFIIAGLDGKAVSPDPQRSDALVIAHVPAERNAVYLVSIPRDLEVNIPGHGPNKINAAYAYGKSALLNATLTELTGLSFDGQVMVDFSGLIAVVDKLGGVTMCVDELTKSWHTGKIYEPGCRTFTGADVKDYLRQRLNLPNGAMDRDRHVAQFLAALARQITARGTLTDLAKVRALARLIGTSVTVEAGRYDVTKLAWELRGGLRQVVSVELPSLGVIANGGLTPNIALAPAAAAGLFDALRADTMAAWVAANPKAVLPLG